MNTKLTAKPLAQGNIQKAILALLLPIALLLIGWQNVFAASITTDQLDYYPFTYVYVTGDGFTTNEAVELKLEMMDSNGSWVMVASTADYPNPWTTSADASGNFSDDWYIWTEDFLGVQFLLTATGHTSQLTAQTTFSDSPKVGSVTVSAQTGSLCSGTAGTATYTVTVSRGSGSGSNGSFTAPMTNTTALPTGATASFSPSTVSFAPAENSKTTTLTITTTAATPAGATIFTVKAATSASDFAVGDGTLTINQGPTVTCPGNISANTALGSCSAFVTYDVDTSGPPVPSLSYAFTGATTGSGSGTGSGSTTFSKGITTVTITATGACGSETCNFTVTVNDAEPPTITAAGANATINCPAAPLFTPPTASDNCSPAPTVVEVNDVTVPGSCAGSYVRTKTWKAVDSSGNESGTVGQTISVVDTTAPAISALPEPSTVECPASPSFTTPTATDACDPSPTLTFADVTIPGTCPQSHVVTRTWTATDHCNKSSVASQVITVVDTTAPVISALPGPSTVECPASPSFTTPTATDACDPSPTLTFADVTTAGICPQSHVVTRTWTATDACGHSSSASQIINVVDTTAPSISSLPAPTTIECPATPSFATPTATDACDPSPTLTFADVTTPGTCPQASIVTRTWTATDHCGNHSSASQIINVVDTTAPSISSLPAPTTIECPATPSFATPTAIDACDPSPTLTFADVTTPGTCPQSHIVTRTWTATDACGHSSTASQVITVVDTTAPTITCPDDIVLSTGGACTAIYLTDLGTPIVSDGCSGVTVSANRLDQKRLTDPYPVGTTTVRWTATDECGNSASCDQKITVTTDKSIASDFNGTPIAKDNTIWFNAVLKPTLPNNVSGPITIRFSGQKITSPGKFNLLVPDVTVIFDNVACATTTCDGAGRWTTVAPKSGLSGNLFLSGLGYKLPAALPGGVKPVTWSGSFTTDTPGVTFQWKWAAAVYTQFGSGCGAIGVKATDDNQGDCTYHNSDHAGTPEGFKSYVIGGARGGGGSNWTGSLSGTQSVAPCNQ